MNDDLNVFTFPTVSAMIDNLLSFTKENLNGN